MRTELEGIIAAACQELFGQSVNVQLTRPEAEFGDFATNIALQLSKTIGKNPREVAETIAGHLSHDSINKIDIAGPGFINIWLNDQALISLAQTLPSQTHAGKTAVAEYSDPNPFKVLHAGHLYTTLVGDAVASLLEHAGAKVHRVNFGGDVGLHVAKAMWGIIQELGGEQPEKLEAIRAADRPAWISARYVEGNEAYETDKKAKTEIIEINKKVYSLHTDNDHDSLFAQIYWTCRQWSYEGFDELYKRLQVDAFEKYYPESQTTQKGVELAEQALNRGILEKSDGAVVFKGDDDGLHTRVFLNSEGLPTYETKDLGLAATKWQDYQPDINVIITANDIEQYMKVVLRVVQNFHPEIAERTIHLTHGMVKLAGGAKMSSRKGNILQANDILGAAETAAKQANPDNSYDTVLAAVKYAFLKNRIGGDIIYDPNESVALEGNSGPYLQYAHARARSILRKADKTPETTIAALEQNERSLMRKIGEFAEVVERATSELMPHHICTYLYELAQTFNSFYEHNRVIGDDREAVRLQLVAYYADTLKAGLQLLNIQAPEQM